MELNLFFKKILFTFIFSLIGIACFSLYGQEINLSKIKPIAQKVMNKYGDGVYFKEYNPFNQVEVKEAPNTKSDDADKYLVTIDPQDLKSIFSSGEPFIRLSIPYGQQKISLLLAKTDVLSQDFQIHTSDGKFSTDQYRPGTYYRGMIEGDYTSLVALSFFNDDIIGMISTAQDGNIMITKTAQRNTFMLYSDKNLKAEKPAMCGTVEPEGYAEEVKKILRDGINTRDQKCFKQYLECDYALFLNKCSVSATVREEVGSSMMITRAS